MRLYKGREKNIFRNRALIPRLPLNDMLNKFLYSFDGKKMRLTLVNMSLMLRPVVFVLLDVRFFAF